MCMCAGAIPDPKIIGNRTNYVYMCSFSLASVCCALEVASVYIQQQLCFPDVV